MIIAKSTPNHLGVTVMGDLHDLELLYDALHAIVGDEDEHRHYESARLRVLSVCYDLRHALMGDREIEFVENGMDQDKMRRFATITSNNNVYLAFNTFWPEMIFVLRVLNIFVNLYAERQAESRYNMFAEKKNIWDENIAHVKVFQAAMANCIKDNVTKQTYGRMLNLLTREDFWYSDYVTQYIDLLNIRFEAMNKEQRLKNLSVMVKRIVEQGQEYESLKQEVLQAAKEHGCSPDEISLNVDYPEDVEW